MKSSLLLAIFTSFLLTPGLSTAAKWSGIEDPPSVYVTDDSGRLAYQFGIYCEPDGFFFAGGAMPVLSQSDKIVLGIGSQQFALAPIDKFALNTEYPLPTEALLAMATAKTMYVAAVDFSGNDLSMFEISLDGFAQAFTQSGCAG